MKSQAEEKLICYDMLPTQSGWILRCESNGRVVSRSLDEETREEFVARCKKYCEYRATEARKINLCLYTPAGMLDGSFDYPKETPA